MSYIQENAVVRHSEAVAAQIFLLVLYAPGITAAAQPGQFIHILPAGCTLRRPISIARIDRERGELTILFEVKGEGTRQLAALRPQETADLIGPLGRGFTLDPNAKRVVLVGGGIGTPPMLSLAAYYKKKAAVIRGHRTAAAVTLQQAFDDLVEENILCTDDGTSGRHALVTEPLDELLSRGGVDHIYACGPRIMLKNVAAIAQSYGVDCEVSMEERMACGVGACLGCAIRLQDPDHPEKEHMGHVCKDGPVFAAQEVIW